MAQGGDMYAGKFGQQTGGCFAFKQGKKSELLHIWDPFPGIRPMVPDI